MWRHGTSFLHPTVFENFAVWMAAEGMLRNARIEISGS